MLLHHLCSQLARGWSHCSHRIPLRLMNIGHTTQSARAELVQRRTVVAGAQREK